MDGIAGHDDQGVFPQSAYDDAGFDLCRELGGKSKDAHRKDGEERFDQSKEQFLEALDAFQECFSILRPRHEGQAQAEGGGDEHHGKYIARQEWLQHIIRHYVQNMIIVSHSAQLVRHRCRAGAYDISGKISRCHPKIERQTDARRKDGGEKRVDYGVGKDAAGLLLASQGRQGSNHRQRDGGHSNELEEAGEYGGNEIEKLIQRFDAEPSQTRADNERQNPENKLVPLLFVLVLL